MYAPMPTPPVIPNRDKAPLIGPSQSVAVLRAHARSATRVAGAMTPAASADFFRTTAKRVTDRETARILIVMAREFARVARTGEA